MGLNRPFKLSVKALKFTSSNPHTPLSSPGVTAREFIDSRVTGKSRLEIFWDFLSKSLSVRPGRVNIFGIVDGGEAKTVDLHFSVLTDSGYVRPEKLHGILSAHKKKVGGLGSP